MGGSFRAVSPLVWAALLSSIVACSSSRAPAARAPAPCASTATAQDERALLAADLKRVAALGLPEGPGPCRASTDCFANDPCFDGVCIDGECSGTVRADGEACKALPGAGGPGQCRRGRCVPIDNGVAGGHP